MQRDRRPDSKPAQAERLWLADTADWLELWEQEDREPEPHHYEPDRPDTRNHDYDYGPEL